MQKKETSEKGGVYSAEQASQGEIILKRPWQRAVFIGGLAAAILLPFVIELFAR